MRNIDQNGFDYMMQEQEANNDGHAQETISYVAWEPFSGSINGLAVEVGKTGNDIDHKLTSVSYAAGFKNPPMALADMQTFNGSDTASLRFCNITSYGFETKIEEEQSVDDEIAHTTEAAGYIAVGQASAIPLETGEVDINHNWSRVEFDAPFTEPVVVASMLSYNGNQPCILRIKNVDSTGFDIRLQEYEYLDGYHAVETVSYMVMEHGSYTLENGTRIEAGTVPVSAIYFRQQNFSSSFNKPPVMITSITTFNEQDAVTERVKNIDSYGFSHKLQEQELNSDGHGREEVSYIAWEPFSGAINGLTIEVGKTGNDINTDFGSVAYTTGSQLAPVVLVDMQTTNGGDTASLRSRNNTAHGFETKIEEEQSADAETGHAAETAGYIALFGE
ncbi:MAG: hypothetical protein GQ559_01925 [Desulfobulbaceae bacterium]|nr:hypothetical protein [Desulfobulbaceae bacterium]